VCLAILSHYATPINGKDHRQILQTNVMEDLVKSTLQESGIYGYDGDETLSRQASGEGHTMRFTYAHIEDPIRKFPGYSCKSCPFLHSSGDGNQPGILPKKTQHRFPEHLTIARSTTLAAIRSYTMETHHVLFRPRIAFALLSDNVNESRPSGMFSSAAQGSLQPGDIVSIERAYIGKTNLLQHHCG